MKELKDLSDLLGHEVQVLYEGEQLIIAALPRMIQKSNNEALKAALAQHLEETQIQKQRLEQAARLLNISPEGDGNPSLKGLIAEGEKVFHKDTHPDTLDAAIIAGVQKVEHYEISGYGSAAYYAEELGLQSVADLLRQNLAEEKATDARLNDLAKRSINPKSAEAVQQ